VANQWQEQQGKHDVELGGENITRKVKCVWWILRGGTEATHQYEEKNADGIRLPALGDAIPRAILLP
jgi:hypothetical protein